MGFGQPVLQTLRTRTLVVIPAQAGIQCRHAVTTEGLDARLRGHDESSAIPSKLGALAGTLRPR